MTFASLRPHEMEPGTVLCDPVLPYTGIAKVREIVPDGLTVTLDLDVLRYDGTIENIEWGWHSTLPLGAVR